MDFKLLAHAKLNIPYPKEVFLEEYDAYILPNAFSICNSLSSIEDTIELNKKWNMIPPEEYIRGDYFEQPGNTTTYRFIKRDRPQWKMLQLLELDTTNIDDALLKHMASFGGPSLRNETLHNKYTFNIKPQYKHLAIWNWIKDCLPFEKINSVHCVSIEEGGMSTIHRDQKGLYDNHSSITQNKVYQQGYVVVCINLSDGGVPLYWSLDGEHEVIKSNDDIYLTNDYFLHGVPICTSRRRQIRVTGIPKAELWELIEKTTIVSIDADYVYDQPN